VEKGEERFAVVLRDDGSVWFEVESFSRMASPLLVLVAPIARRFQRRFLRDACEAMRRAV